MKLLHDILYKIYKIHKNDLIKIDHNKHIYNSSFNISLKHIVD